MVVNFHQINEFNHGMTKKQIMYLLFLFSFQEQTKVNTSTSIHAGVDESSKHARTFNDTHLQCPVPKPWRQVEHSNNLFMVEHHGMFTIAVHCINRMGNIFGPKKHDRAKNKD